MSSLIDLLRFELDEKNLPIRAEQIRARIDSYPLMLIAELVLAPMLVMLMWGKVPHGVLQAWLATVYFVHAAEYYFWRNRRALTKTVAQNIDWDRRFRILTGMAAITWGSAGVLMFVSNDLAYQALLICVVMGLSAGAATSNPFHPWRDAIPGIDSRGSCTGNQPWIACCRWKQSHLYSAPSSSHSCHPC